MTTPLQSESEISVTYQVPPDVLVHTLWLRVLRTPRVIIPSLVILAVAVGCFVAGDGALYFGYFTVAYLLCTPFFLRRTISRSLRMNPHQTDRKTVTFSETGVVAAGADWRTELSWTRFSGFSEDSDFFYLHLLPRGMASMIPKRTFSADQQMAFRELARRKLA